MWGGVRRCMCVWRNGGDNERFHGHKKVRGVSRELADAATDLEFIIGNDYIFRGYYSIF